MEWGSAVFEVIVLQGDSRQVRSVGKHRVGVQNVCRAREVLNSLVIVSAGWSVGVTGCRGAQGDAVKEVRGL